MCGFVLLVRCKAAGAVWQGLAHLALSIISHHVLAHISCQLEAPDHISSTAMIKYSETVTQPSPQHLDPNHRITNVSDDTCSTPTPLTFAEGVPEATGCYASSEPIPSCSSSESEELDSEDPHVRVYHRLSAVYGFLPLPPPPPLPKNRPPSFDHPAPHFDGGIIMAARHIQAALSSDAPRKAAWGIPTQSEPFVPSPIPGWTDGSNAWRAIVYGGEMPPSRTTRYGATGSPSHPLCTCVSPQCSSGEPLVDTHTQHLYAQFSSALSRRAQSRCPSYRPETGIGDTCLRRSAEETVPQAGYPLLCPRACAPCHGSKRTTRITAPQSTTCTYTAQLTVRSPTDSLH